MKQCSTCKEVKDFSYFGKSKQRKDGYRPRCNPCRKVYRDNNKEKIAETNRKYKEANRERIKERDRLYYQKNKDKFKAYQEANKERNRAWWATYYQDNREYHIERAVKYTKERRKTDAFYDFKYRLRKNIREAIKRRGYTKKSSVLEIIGCSFEELHAHLKKTFESNYNKPYLEEYEVHIDHIIPICSAKTEEEVIKLNHWTNLQYLTPEDNLKKGGSF